MQSVIATGFLPYEIGDKILIKNFTKEFIIEDIKMIQYVKSRKIQFEVLTDDGTWYPATLIEKRII